MSTVLLTVGVALAASGSGAMGITAGVFGAQPNAVDFGNVAGSAPQTITETLTNTGATTVNISSTSISGQNQGDFSLSNNSCNGAAVDPNNTCSVDVTFNPSSNGSESASLDITDDDPSSPQSVPLSGTGVASQFSVAGGPLNFGDQRVGTTSTNQSVIVTNNTDYAANPANPNVTGANPGDFGESGCSGAVSGGNTNNTCTVNVDFTPGATGSRSATLNVAGQQVSLSGIGTDPVASVSPGSISFGNQPLHVISQTATITLQNNGTSPLTYSSTGVSGSNPGDFSVSDTVCAATVTIAPAGSCTITVAFNPTATGARSAVININDDDPGNGTQSVNVSGTGTPSSVGFAPATVTYTRAIPAGTSSPGHVVTIRNLTSSPMPIVSTAIGGTNRKNFIRSADTCTGQTLQSNGTCTIHVAFTPSASGRRTAVLSVADNGAVGPHTHQVTLTGTATAPKNPKSVRGTVGCSSVTVHWVPNTATRFAGTIVVRNHSRYPISPSDGHVVRHSSGVAHDGGLKHFSNYYYRVFAKYHSLTHKGQLNYSKGVRLREHTGEICTPQNGARLHNLRPRFTWLPYPTQNGYAFVLQRGQTTIEVNYARKAAWQTPATWRYRSSTHRLGRNRSYTLFLYAYPAAHPNGIFIGKVSFSER
ncbi:MAG TPA: choice-of-anchor D domain-containing protein [Gaiellales bacterium]|nr:choice-of-anchor D domain-containing protein [Gaiellales bacterium]